MEFEEMTKIWDQQTKKTMFVINEKALNNRIKAKLRGSERMNNINDFGLIAISICTAAMVLIIKTISTWNLVTAVILLLISFYIIANRLRREKRSRQFDLSLLGGCKPCY